MKWEYYLFSIERFEVYNESGNLKEFVTAFNALRPEYENTKRPEKFLSELEIKTRYFSDQEEALKYLGLNHWELVSIVVVPDTTIAFYLKRPLVEKDEKTEG
jgi:hypothetical protein